ncbi:chalcone isomerase [Ochromonadaceae sp. CCMP2298]|nr:chalcone isomerase [Ochromonadaceae sp. CCMP2298]|mmetsp:Transcript_11259/g.25036  ORF Transcript_11259/g.25036 Transcript_11259/m.25036 type:complete len:213 (+) Transcript_11259:97-735(+)
MNLLLLLCFILPLLALCEVREAATGHVWQDTESKKLSLAGVGVRVKTIGPIKAKVYSVAVYLDKSLAISRLAKFKGMPAIELANSRDFENSLINADCPKSIMLRMARDVGAEKMVSALAESVKPRIAGDTSALKQFQAVLSEALKDGGAKNNMVFRFDLPNKNKLSLLVDGKARGAINSPALVKAMCAVYLDDKCVSPGLKLQVANTLPSWL